MYKLSQFTRLKLIKLSDLLRICSLALLTVSWVLVETLQVTTPERPGVSLVRLTTVRLLLLNTYDQTGLFEVRGNFLPFAVWLLCTDRIY